MLNENEDEDGNFKEFQLSDMLILHFWAMGVFLHNFFLFN